MSTSPGCISHDLILSFVRVSDICGSSANPSYSIITRVGQDSKIIFCGDASQTDLQKISERSGIIDFQRILQKMPEFSLIEFDIDDIVRSGLVKSYLINKINLGL